MKLVLLPGLDGTGQLFEPLVRVIPSHFSTEVISYPHDKALSYPDLVRLVSRQLPIMEDYVLLAESFSGPVAIEIAATDPGNLKALVLSATFATNPAPLPRILSFVSCRLLFMLGPPQLVVSRYLLGENAPAPLVESFRCATRSVPADVLAFRMRSVINSDVREALAACRLPLLYLRARQDRLVRRRSLVEMQRIKPEMTVVEIEGPHLLLQREPAKCGAAILNYLGGVL